MFKKQLDTILLSAIEGGQKKIKLIILDIQHGARNVLQIRHGAIQKKNT